MHAEFRQSRIRGVSLSGGIAFVNPKQALSAMASLTYWSPIQKSNQSKEHVQMLSCMYTPSSLANVQTSSSFDSALEPGGNCGHAVLALAKTLMTLVSIFAADCSEGPVHV